MDLFNKIGYEKPIFIKIKPSTTFFLLDMNTEKPAIMQKHISYYTSLLNNETVIAFEPVFDPTGNYSVSIVSADSTNTCNI